MAIYDDLAALLKRHSIPTRYRLDLPTLITGLLPSALRRPRLIALLRALLSPMAETYAKYLSYTVRVRRELTYSGQKLAFERALNDRFDPDQARISIEESDSQAEASYDNFLAELEPPAYLAFIAEGPPYLYDFAWVEIVNQVGFIVRVPRTLQPKEAALNARIKELKIALIKHSIVYF